MGLPEDEVTKKTRIIILTLEQHESIGVLVDEVKEVVTLDEDHMSGWATRRMTRSGFSQVSARLTES